MNKFIQSMQDITSDEEKIAAFAEITLPIQKEEKYYKREMMKQASAASYIVPTALGLGAAGTAAYIGTKDATSRAKLKAARRFGNKAQRDTADREIEANKWSKAAPAALGAGLGTMYLTGSAASEKAEKSPPSSCGL